MKEVKKVVLIGASGFVGSALLNETLNRGFEVTAVVRHPEKIKIENESLKVTKADVSSLEEVYEVCKGADAVISAFNPGWNNPDIYDETIKVYLTIIDGVKKAGVNRFLMVGGAGNMCAPAPYVIDASEELIDRVAKDDMVRGVTIAAGGFFGPQGRELRIPLADPKQNDKIEAFEYKGFKITNFEMESSALAGLSRLMGHKAMTVCMVIANRLIKEANTGYKNTIDTLIQTVLDRI